MRQTWKPDDCHLNDGPDIAALDESKQLDPGTNQGGDELEIGGGGADSPVLQTQYACDHGNRISHRTRTRTCDHHDNGLISRSQMNTVSGSVRVRLRRYRGKVDSAIPPRRRTRLARELFTRSGKMGGSGLCSQYTLTT